MKSENDAVAEMFTVEISASANTQDEVVFSGRLIDLETGEPILFGDVAIYNEKKLMGGTQTDFDGYYHLRVSQQMESFTYSIAFSYLGYQTSALTDVQLSKGDACIIKAGIVEEFDLRSGCGFFRYYVIPVYEQDNLTSGQTFTSDQIRNSPTRNK